MNTAGNQRYKDTEKKIMHAYGAMAGQKNLKTISVSDICRAAGIHRTTFYGHFDSMYELELFMEHDQLNRSIQKLLEENNLNLENIMREQLNYFYRNREIIRLQFISEDNLRLYEDTYLDELAEQHSDEYIRLFGCRSKEEMEYHHAFFHAGAMSMVRKWILGGCRESVDVMTKYLIHFCTINR